MQQEGECSCPEDHPGVAGAQLEAADSATPCGPAPTGIGVPTTVLVFVLITEMVFEMALAT
jgi:hypothetical protein